ncbi:50S ribosomal protein L19 [Candidatus Microgenomates bacterium]|nr:50S ribosomal protein L19 [Candidatus Microgenomates bacterium]
MALFTKYNEIEFGVGDTIRLHLKSAETGRSETIFEGIVIAIRGEGENKSFTVRRMGVDNVGIEQIFPLSSPWIQKVDVKQKGTSGIKHAKLYYLRGRSKAAFDKMTHRTARHKKS